MYSLPRVNGEANTAGVALRRRGLRRRGVLPCSEKLHFLDDDVEGGTLHCGDIHLAGGSETPTPNFRLPLIERGSSSRRQFRTLSKNCRLYPNSWCQIEAGGPVWYQFGTMEGEKDSQPGTEMAPLWKFVENLTRKEGMAGKRVAAAKLHY